MSAPVREAAGAHAGVKEAPAGAKEQPASSPDREAPQAARPADREAPQAPRPPDREAPQAPRPPEKRERREILLTFDDGPHLSLTPQVLDILDQHGIKAVFFVNGWRLQGHSAGADKAREIMRDAVRRGHIIGNHTVHHYFLCGKRGPKIATQEIEENAALIEQAIGQRPLLYRTPYGAHCKTLAATLQVLGLKSTGWDIDPQDWRLRDTDKVLAFMQQSLKRLRGRAIVLFHDVHPTTVAALPKLLDWIDQDNLARRAAGQAELKIIDYGYLLPERPLVPPVIDGMGRVLIESALSWPPLVLLAPLWTYLSAGHA